MELVRLGKSWFPDEGLSLHHGGNPCSQCAGDSCNWCLIASNPKATPLELLSTHHARYTKKGRLPKEAAFFQQTRTLGTRP